MLLTLLRSLRARPRLGLSALLGIGVALAWPWMGFEARDVTRGLIAWNVGTVSYLVLTAVMMVRSTHEDIHKRALTQDEGAAVILAMVVLAALSSLGAIVAELAVARNETGLARSLHIGLAAFTVLTSWTFTQMMFALHYAHEYYQSLHANESPGLVFPDTRRPEYFDFLYVAAVIGTSAQTADVSFGSSAMRRVGLVHCVLAFFFNATLLALMVNVGAALL
jgi:uncharacterized membrane protein